MEKFFNFLIWIQLVPAFQQKKDAQWNLNYTSPKFLILISFFTTCAGFYMYYICITLQDLENQNYQLTPLDLSDIAFKVLSMNSAPFGIILFGNIACVRDNKISHSSMKMPLSTLIFIIALMVLFCLGLFGIHFKTHAGCWTTLLLIVPAIITIFVANSVCHLITLTQFYHFLSSCPDGDKQDLITADEVDAVLESFRKLKSATEIIFIVTLPYLQISLVFSLYNTLQGL